MCGKCFARVSVLPGEIPKRSFCHPAHPFLLAAAANYDSKILRSLIYQLKFLYVEANAAPLSDILEIHLKKSAGDLKDFTVIPIPLSRRRQRERDFNQSALIAANVSWGLNLAYLENVLIRVKNKKAQSLQKDTAQRFENIKDCFAVTDDSQIKGRNILLVDDVTTSGATLYEAAAVLKKSGAKTILAATAAKA